MELLEAFWLSEENSLFDYSSEHANSSEVKIEDRVLEGWCEFVEGLISEGCSGRLCRFGGCCFDFDKPDVYVSCPTRKEKLKERT